MLVDSAFDSLAKRPAGELACRAGVEPTVCASSGLARVGRSLRRADAVARLISSRSLPLRLVAISGRFISSLLPPSFARRRFATSFFPAVAPAAVLAATAMTSRLPG
jgi:hypothetical protein